MNGLVVGFSGRIASGKTTIAKALAELLSWPYVSFGAYVRRVAIERGFNEPSRAVLQEVGESLIASGWGSFCKSVLAQAEWQPGQSLVVDGIRHIEAYDILKSLVAPSVFLLIYIDVGESEQQKRFGERDNLDGGELNAIESHSTEHDVINSLPAMADLVVNGSGSVRDITRKIMSWLQQRKYR